MPNGPPPPLVLVADLDQGSTRFMMRNLQRSGFRVQVVGDSESLVSSEATEDPEVVLLDRDLPGCLEALRRIREASEVPIIFTSLEDDHTTSEGLREGADAVLMKPFSAELLIAHIESAIRRVHAHASPSSQEVFAVGDLAVNFTARVVMLSGSRLHLSAREFRLLQVLSINAGRVISHEQLLWLVWGPGYEGCGDLLRGYVRNLRRKIGDDARHPRYIQTENQVGYWMQPPA